MNFNECNVFYILSELGFNGESLPDEVRWIIIDEESKYLTIISNI